MAKQDHEYGIGERTDGTIDIFPESELQARLAEWRAQQEGETDEDNLADLDEVEALFEDGPIDEDAEPEEADIAEDAFNEADHPRGQPENAGEFASSPGGSKKNTELGGKTLPKAAELYKEFASINEWLRGDRSPAAGSAKENEPVIKGMDDLIASSSLPKPTTLYRGFSGFDGPDIETLWNAGSKHEMTDPAFLSTSTDIDVARRFTGESGLSSYVGAIDVPAGMPAFQFPDDEQGEVVLPRGTTIKLVKADHDKKILHFSIREKPDIRKSMNKVTEVAASTQPVKSLDELYDRAKAEEPAFRKMVEDIAEVTGSKPKFGVDKQTGSILKTRESSERKLRDELGGDFTKLRDVLRGTVVGDSVEKTRDAAATFVAKQGENILRVKDRHIGPTSSGYRDILVNFRTPGGLVAELQFNSKAMTEAKEASGHQLYDSIRTGALAGKTFDELQAAARAIYEKAYADDGDGHWEMGQ